MLKTVFVWLLLHVLVFTNCMRNKADLVVPQAFLSPHRVSNFFLGNISSFVKWPLMRSCIFFILLNHIADIAECAIFCLYNFLYAWDILLSVNASGMFFLLLIFSFYFLRFLFARIYLHSPVIIFSFQNIWFNNCAVSVVFLNCRT